MTYASETWGSRLDVPHKKTNMLSSHQIFIHQRHHARLLFVRTKKREVHVIRTNYRPVPLSHHLFAGLKLHKMLEGNSAFINAGYKSAKLALTSLKEKNALEKKKKPQPSRPTGSRNSSWQQVGNKNNWNSLVKYLEREFLTPTVVFSFSKKVSFSCRLMFILHLHLECLSQL